MLDSGRKDVYNSFIVFYFHGGKIMHLNWKKEMLTIPNLLSLFRLVLIPVYVYIYLNATEAGHYVWAGGVLAVSCLTDAVDGKIARKYNMISNVGKLLDPMADKMTQLALTICLAEKYPILNPVLALFLVKEMFQLVAVIVNLYHGKALPGALMAGKICTTVLFVSFITLVMFPDIPELLVDGIALLNAVVLSFSFISYILAYYGKNKKVEDFHAE